MDLGQLQEVLGYSFTEEALLLEAVTHTTWLKEERDQGRALGLGDQQRLEFLGDAFLGYVVGRALFNTLPDAAEGELTKRRSAVVKGAFIQEVGARLGLLGVVRVGRGEQEKLALNNKVLEDTVEALIGAVLEDGGEAAARGVVERLFLAGGLNGKPAAAIDPIIEYTERWQGQLRESPPNPKYERSGPDDAPTWRALVTHPLGDVRGGEGRDKAEARRAACAAVLASWEG